MSESLNIEIRTPSYLKNNKEEYEYLKELNADIAIVVAYGQIIPKEILTLTKKGFINIHASLLPKWRGAAPIQRSIMNLDKQTGISIMKIDERLDTGPICNSYPLNILENDDFIQNIFGATCQICLNPDFKALAPLKIALKLFF